MKKKIFSILTAMVTASAILPSFASFTGFNTAAAENIAYTEAQLREFVSNDTIEITLGADITLTEPLEITNNSNEFRKLNMNGFTLDGDTIVLSCRFFDIYGTLDADIETKCVYFSESFGEIYPEIYSETVNGNITGSGNLMAGTYYGDISGGIHLSDCTVYGNYTKSQSYDSYITFNDVDFYGDIASGITVSPNNSTFYGNTDGVTFEYNEDYTLITIYIVGSSVYATKYQSLTLDADKYLLSEPSTQNGIAIWYYDKECTQEVDFSQSHPLSALTAPYSVTLYGLDTVSPVITGLEADKTYCGDVTFSVTDNVKVAKVSFGDEVLTPDENGLYTIKAGSGFGLVTATDTSGNTAYSDAFRVNDDHVYSWQSDDTYYWQECINCGDAKEKSEIPQIDSQIIGDDTIKRGENYIFSFEIPSGFEQALADADFGKSINDIIVFEIDGNTLRGAVFTAKDENNSDSFDVNVYLTLPSGYNLTVSKTVNIVDEEAVTTTTTTASVTTTTASDTSPKTGENSPLPTVIALFGLSLGAACVTICRKQKEEK